MQFIVSLLLGIVLISCRTTKDNDHRDFSGAEGSNKGIAGVTTNPGPDPKPGEPLSIFPNTPAPVQEGAFYQFCQAKSQLPSQQALTVTALLAAVHQRDCTSAEKWLRDQRNKSIMIESERLVELQTLTILRNYPHIRDLYIRIAKGVDPVCPVNLPQTCHFLQAED